MLLTPLASRSRNCHRAGHTDIFDLTPTHTPVPSRTVSLAGSACGTIGAPVSVDSMTVGLLGTRH